MGSNRAAPGGPSLGFMPTSFEFLTSGSRERQRVVFRLSSKYHETSVLYRPSLRPSHRIAGVYYRKAG